MESALNNSARQAPSRSSQLLEGGVSFLVALVITAFAPRVTAWLFVAIYAVVAVWSPSARRFGVVPTAICGFLALSLLPIDISFRTAPGLPRFARVINTLADPSLAFRADKQGALQRIRRGEFVVLPNCTGAYQPTWILVW